VIAMDLYGGHVLTKIGQAEGVMQGSLFHVDPAVEVDGQKSEFLVASLGLTFLMGDLNFAVFLSDKDGITLGSCAYDEEEFVCQGVEQPIPWASELRSLM